MRALRHTVGLAAVVLLFAATTANAQFVPTSSTSGRPAFANYPPLDPNAAYLHTDTVVRRVPLSERSPGIFMTSINFPGVYGSYTIGVASASFDISPRQSWQSYTTRPRTYPQAVDDTPAGFAPGTIRVLVPGNAELFFQDEKVPGAGFIRELTTPPLSPDNAYRFEVRARWKENGQTVSRRDLVRIHGNETVVVDLGRTDSSVAVEPQTSEIRTAPVLPVPVPVPTPAPANATPKPADDAAVVPVPPATLKSVPRPVSPPDTQKRQ